MALTIHKESAWLVSCFVLNRFPLGSTWLDTSIPPTSTSQTLHIPGDYSFFRKIVDGMRAVRKFERYVNAKSRFISKPYGALFNLNLGIVIWCCSSHLVLEIIVNFLWFYLRTLMFLLIFVRRIIKELNAFCALVECVWLSRIRALEEIGSIGRDYRWRLEQPNSNVGMCQRNKNRNERAELFHWQPSRCQADDSVKSSSMSSS